MNDCGCDRFRCTMHTTTHLLWVKCRGVLGHLATGGFFGHVVVEFGGIRRVPVTANGIAVLFVPFPGFVVVPLAGGCASSEFGQLQESLEAWV